MHTYFYKSILCFFVVSACLLFSFGCSQKAADQISSNDSIYTIPVTVRLTYPDQSRLYAKGPDLSFSGANFALPTITIDTAQVFQQMDGFGYTLTGGTAMLLMTKMTTQRRLDILNELFRHDEDNIGVSYLRISIGASDLDSYVFSYCDTENNEPDPELDQFTLAPDETYLIPVLKEILGINPAIKIMGSAWSAPVWMKTNMSAKGGKLKPEYYSSYAQYFVRYVDQMAQRGIPIDAVTIQNEPENSHNTPSLVMTAAEQGNFIKNHLGPAWRDAGIQTKILLFDHNCDHPDYPISILNDPATRNFVDGSAFHLYAGEIQALSTVRNAHPDKNVYFTEQWTSSEGSFAGDLSWHLRNLIIGAPRNWSKTVLEWNLASDENFDPHTEGGCAQCQGALTINSINGLIQRKVSYYIIAHAAQYVRPGSVRIFSSEIPGIPNVAFITPNGDKVLIVLNDRNETASFAVGFKNLKFSASLPSGAVATYRW